MLGVVCLRIRYWFKLLKKLEVGWIFDDGRLMGSSGCAAEEGDG